MNKHKLIAHRLTNLAADIDAAARYAGISDIDGGVRMGTNRIYTKIKDGKYTRDIQPTAGGTVACAAGWCAIALGAKVIERDYTDGVNAVNEYLGVSLHALAAHDSKLWGNSDGRAIWAFGGEGWGQPSRRFAPQVIATHLRGVANRIATHPHPIYPIDR